ncbi:MAG: hypothetical protein IJP30_00250 [Clostridia bacterium]|nr:hypothetical protein [Clostridia bacterium]MBQ9988157.1 hypothetical protein [Clostridia bacterium]
MKATIQLIGYVSHFTNGVKSIDVELPGETACMGDLLVEAGKTLGEEFMREALDLQNRAIKLCAMYKGNIIGYETPIPDGATAQLTFMMDGGC